MIHCMDYLTFISQIDIFNLYTCYLQLEEISGKYPLQQSWETAGNSALYGRLPSQSDGFFQPLERNSSMDMGYVPVSPHGRQ